MPTHLVLGAGSAGRSTTERLLAAGHEVVLASRSGRHRVAGAATLALDVRDADALSRAAAGKATIVNALNPPHYYAWQREWPPMVTSIRTAARVSGADVVTVGNLYGYGRVESPMTEDGAAAPNGHKGAVRVAMWRDLLADQAAGLYRVSELRASDYTGDCTDASVLNTFLVARVAQGRRAMVPAGKPDVPHSWTNVADLGELAAALITRGADADWGRAWHVPTAAPRTLRQVADDVAALSGTAPARLSVIPPTVRFAVGLVMPTVWALRETAHQFERPFVLDSRAAQQRFGLTPTVWDDTLRAAIAAVAPTVEAVSRRRAA